MFKVIETNLSMLNDTIVDHQSRIVEVESWESYIEEFKTIKSINRKSLGGCGNGATIPKHIIRVSDLKYNDFHLSADVHFENGWVTKKLAYLI